jgi:amidohydrolase
MRVNHYAAGMTVATTSRSAVRAAVEGAADDLVALSHRIHAHPELGYEEFRASAWVGEALSAAGFAVEAGVGGIPTALVATVGSGPLVVGICAEYDALPSIGHACGHNVIAAAAVGAGLALARVADEAGITVRVLGTPAEEGGGGKVLMLQRGAFDGCHLAMMVHPAPYEMSSMGCLAVSHVQVRYTGKEAHASAHPEDGINAADALTVAQVGIGLLRQHIRQEERIHGITTIGGAAPNIVPAHTAARYYIRAQTLERLAELAPRVRRCFEAGALASGAELEIRPESAPYSEMLSDEWLEAAWRRNAQELGRELPDYPEEVLRQQGSTDMANVSLALPVIHPMLGVESLPASNHQPEFTAACVREPADRAVVQGAIGMAWTVLDAAADEAERERLLAGPARPPSELGREHVALAGAPLPH